MGVVVVVGGFGVDGSPNHHHHFHKNAITLIIIMSIVYCFGYMNSLAWMFAGQPAFSVNLFMNLIVRQYK